MRYSEIEWYWKALAWAIFLAIMAVVWWFFYNLVYVWLPREAAAMLGALGLGLGLGFVLGEWNSRRSQHRHAGARTRSNQRIDQRLDDF